MGDWGGCGEEQKLRLSRLAGLERAVRDSCPSRRVTADGATATRRALLALQPAYVRGAWHAAHLEMMGD